MHPDDITRFVQGSGENGPADYSDILQGQIGNCYFLAAVMALIKADASALEMIVRDVDADYEYYVTYFTAAYASTVMTIAFDLRRGWDAVLFPRSVDVDAATGQVEVWVHILEQAYAQTQGGYGSISDGGRPEDVWLWLTGHEGSWQATAGLAASELSALIETHMNAGKQITFNTSAGATGLFDPGHAYLVDKAVKDANDTILGYWMTNPHTGKSSYYSLADMVQAAGDISILP